MPTVKEWIDCYMASVAFAAVWFCSRSMHKIWRVGIIKYSVTLFFASMAWPFFISRKYF